MSSPQPPKPAANGNGNNKLKWIALGGAALVGLYFVATYTSSRDGSSRRHVAATGKLGTALRDGRLEFVVRSVQCGVGQIGPDDADELARGQFCLVSLLVKNVGDQPQTMPDDAQKAFGTDGRQYDTDPSAGLYANKSNDVWQTEIKPGDAVTGTIVYDLPRSAELAQLELHDSATSAGVRVELR